MVAYNIYLMSHQIKLTILSLGPPIWDQNTLGHAILQFWLIGPLWPRIWSLLVSL